MAKIRKEILFIVSSLIFLQNLALANFLSPAGPEENALPRGLTKGLDSPEAMLEDCVLDTLWEFLSLEGLSVLVSWTSQREKVPPKVILKALADAYGFSLQEADLAPPNRHFPPIIADDVMSPASEDEFKSFANGGYTLLDDDSAPLTKLNSDLELSPPDGLPKALLALLTSHGDVVTSRWIALSPSTSFLDLLKTANKEPRPKMAEEFNFKLKKLKSRRCIGLAVVGNLRSTPSHPLLIQVFDHTLEVVWRDPCLPKVNELLIHSGYVVTVSSTK